MITSKVLEVVYEVARQKEIQVVTKEVLKGSLIAGIGAAVGGLLAGPVGFPIGGAIGGLVGMKAVEDFKPLHRVIMEDMSPAQRENLARKCSSVISEFDAYDAFTIASIVMRGDALNILLANISEFVKYNLNANLRY
ncbi:Uncharacterised protein g5372 [Pycnogonum litorale]